MKGREGRRGKEGEVPTKLRGSVLERRQGEAEEEEEKKQEKEEEEDDDEGR
jgi:hypothetical protein